MQNSNSYINTMLYAIGLDVNDYIAAVTPPDVERYPGKDANVLLYGNNGRNETNDTDYKNGVRLIAEGSDGNDIMRAGNNDDTLRALRVMTH